MTDRWRSTAADALILTALLVLASAPFAAAIFEPGKTPQGLDFTQHYSREASIRLALRSTWVPLWNPNEFSGFPLQADLQTGVFYPPSVALRLVSLPSFLTWTVIFHVWMFGVGGYALSRAFGVTRAAAVVTAAGLMLGGITIPRVYAGHLDVLRTVAWVPLSLAAAVRSVERQSVWPSPLVVIVLAIEVLAGFLQLVCYTFGAIAIYSVFSILWPASGARSWLRTGTIAIHLCLLVTLVAGITAFQMMPTTRLVMAAGRTQGVPYDSADDDALKIRELPAVVFSPISGSAVPWESWESSAYVGWLPAALAPLALFASKRRRAVVFFVMVAALTLTLATASPLYRLHHLIFPMFRIPGRLMPFWSISICVLGAIGLEWLASRTAKAGAVVVLVAGLIVCWDALTYSRHFVSVRDLTDRFSGKAPLTPTPYGRVLSLCEGKLYTSELTALGLASVDGYNSYFLDDYARLAEMARGDRPAEQRTAFPRIGELGTLSDLGVVSLMNVTEIVTCEPLNLPGLELIGEGDQMYVYRNHQAMGRVAPLCEGPSGGLALGVPGCADGVQTEVMVADTPTGVFRVRVSLPAPRVLVLSEPYYPERRAWIDGKETPIEKVEVALSAVRVGPGEHLVELRVVPTSLYYGSIVSVSVLALWLATIRPRRRALPKDL